MTARTLYPALAGFYSLTADGRIGRCDPTGEFVLDARLSAAFADYNRRFLESYLARPDESGFRVGIVYQAREPRRWGSETFTLETAMVKNLYSVSGPRTQALTEFQRKNREQSTYRGMELLLEYRNAHFPDAAVYAPVLFNRETRLDQYPTLLDSRMGEEDRDIPVIEVLNLLAGIPMPKRNSPAVHALVQTLHHSIVRKDVRKAVSYDIVEQVPITRPPTQAIAAGTPHHSVARKDVRKAVSYDIVEQVPARPPAQSTAAGWQVAAEVEVNASRAPILLTRSEAPDDHAFDPGVSATNALVTTKMLKGITQFRHLNTERLHWLAREAALYRALAGTPLLKRGSTEAWNFYLIEGRIQIEAADGAKQVIEGGTPKAAAPVAFLKPRKYSAIALTPVSFLWINDLVLQLALTDERTFGHATLAPA